MAKDIRVNLVMEPDLFEKGKALAAMHKISFSELLCTLLQKHVEKNAAQLKKYEEVQKQLAPIE